MGLDGIRAFVFCRAAFGPVLQWTPWQISKLSERWNSGIAAPVVVHPVKERLQGGGENG
jgi:hypothetical protein